MGMLRHVGSSLLNVLSTETSVGRSARCGLLLSNALVSGLHASIRWSRQAWELRDLGSTNGTYLNGVRLRAAETKLLSLGDFISFGAVENRYEVVEIGAPSLSAVCEDRTIVSAEGPLLVLPSANNPLVTVYRDAQGNWQMEGSDGVVTPVASAGRFQVLGKVWELLVPEEVARTQGADGMDVRQSGIRFFVSADEENVRIVLWKGSHEVSIESRASNYLLLTLARRRLRDCEAGIAVDEAGWVLREDLARDLATTSEHVNVDVFRIRKRLAAVFCNAAEIIERRTGTGQLRIGVADIQVLRTSPSAPKARAEGADV